MQQIREAAKANLYKFVPVSTTNLTGIMRSMGSLLAAPKLCRVDAVGEASKHGTSLISGASYGTRC